MVERMPDIMRNVEAWTMLKLKEELLKKLLARDLSAKTETDKSRDDFDFEFSREELKEDY